MELNDEAKEAVKELGAAINSAIEKSTRVAESIDTLRELGYLAQLTLRLEIGLQDLSELEDGEAPHIEETEIDLELTEDDLRTLRQMKIKLDPED
ncbi:MAG TPA: hypothetical protein VGO50_18450 [Pyrinomonadaceae bacterium]|nr:hypothetical protein [Pyrinomonadaceae bacterium]